VTGGGPFLSIQESPTECVAPISHRGNPSEIFEYMLLADEPNGAPAAVQLSAGLSRD